MKYIKPEIEIAEVLSEDILTESPTVDWGEVLVGNGQLGLDENDQPILNGSASDFVG